jgi:hypothetical protein
LRARRDPSVRFSRQMPPELPSHRVVRAFATTSVVVIAVTLAGCGDGGGSDAATTDSGTTTSVQPAEVSAVRVSGLYPNDTWSGRTVTYERSLCERGRLSVSLSGDAGLFVEPTRIVARSNGAVVARVRFRPEGGAVLSVPISPPAGSSDCRVSYTVTPTAIPAEVTAGLNPDPRVLGAHFNRFVYRPKL